MTIPRPRIAISLGDPRGIGPEVTRQALADHEFAADFILVGAQEQLASAPGTQVVSVGSWRCDPQSNSDADPARLREYRRAAGVIAGRSVEAATQLVLQGKADALVTAPIDKHAVNLAGFPWPGHTEWLASLAGGVDVAMMLASDRLRVVLVTTHLALRDVPSLITTQRLIQIGRIADTGLRAWFGISHPRIAICALNPHAGEEGLFGDEEIRVMQPAAKALGAYGPFPADTVFVRAMNGEFDAVLAPYHDVGMTAIKVASFGRGVNITLGLPFPRTSPDHGTALEIAGQGKANAASMIEAIRTAVDMSRRQPTASIERSK